MKRIVAIAILLLAILYLSDYVSVRFRIPRSRDPFGVVRVQRYYAVPQKSGKPDLYFDQPQNQTCVHSLFPHFGDPPCWYLKRKSEQRINE
ncbi:MAG: hypothetical protein ACRD3O_01500 [Terriglobia bacterium]